MSLDFFILFRPDGWEGVCRCGNVRHEFIEMHERLQAPRDFVAVANALRKRNTVGVDESWSPIVLSEGEETEQVFADVCRVAKRSDMAALGRLADLAYVWWGRRHEDAVDRMRKVAQSRSPLDFFLLFREDGVALMDEVFMREEIASVVRPRTYSHITEESQNNGGTYLVTSDPPVAMKAGDEEWAMALAHVIVHEDRLVHSAFVSPVPPHDDWRKLLECVAKGSRTSLEMLAGRVRKHWADAKSMCLMLDDAGEWKGLNHIVSTHTLPPCSMSALLTVEQWYPKLIAEMAAKEEAGLVKPLALAGDGHGYYEACVMRLDCKHEVRRQYEEEKAKFNRSVRPHHRRCVEYVTMGLKAKRSFSLLVDAANYWSRVPFFTDRVSLKWGFLLAWHKVTGSCKMADYVRFVRLERALGMRVLEDEGSDPVLAMLGMNENLLEVALDPEMEKMGEPIKLVLKANPMKRAIDSATPETKARFDEEEHFMRRVKQRKLQKKIAEEAYVLADNSPENTFGREAVRAKQQKRRDQAAKRDKPNKKASDAKARPKPQPKGPKA